MNDDNRRYVRRTRGMIILAVVLAIICGGLVIFRNMPSNQARRQMYLGQKYLATGDYDEAVLAYLEAVKIRPRSKDTHLGLGKAYFSQADSYEDTDTEKAVDAYENAAEAFDAAVDYIEDNSERSDTYEQSGDAYMAAGTILLENNGEVTDAGEDETQTEDVSGQAQELLEKSEQAYQNALDCADNPSAAEKMENAETTLEEITTATASQTEEDATEEDTEEVTAGSEETEVTEDSEETEPYADFATTYVFTSGAGGWETTLTLQPDGTFEGEYLDTNLGDVGDEYPNGSAYISDFTGKFSDPVQKDEFTWTMTMEELNTEGTLNESYIEDGMKYTYSDPYGLDGGKDFTLYTPGKDISDMEDLKSWMLGAVGEAEDGILPCCCIGNNQTGEYFFGWKEPAENGIYSASLLPAEEKDQVMWETGYADEVSISGDTLKVHGAFAYYSHPSVSGSGFPDRFTTEGTITFKINSSTAFHGYGGEDEEGNAVIDDYSRSDFLSVCSKLNGLTLTITVENGVVTELGLHS